MQGCGGEPVPRLHTVDSEIDYCVYVRVRTALDRLNLMNIRSTNRANYTGKSFTVEHIFRPIVTVNVIVCKPAFGLFPDWLKALTVLDDDQCLGVFRR